MRHQNSVGTGAYEPVSGTALIIGLITARVWSTNTVARLAMRNALRGIQGLRDDASLPELLGMAGVTQGDRMVVAKAVRDMFGASGLDAVVMRRRDEVRVDGGGDGKLAG